MRWQGVYTYARAHIHTHVYTPALARGLSAMTAERERLEARAGVAEALEREMAAMKERFQEVALHACS